MFQLWRSRATRSHSVSSTVQVAVEDDNIPAVDHARAREGAQRLQDLARNSVRRADLWDDPAIQLYLRCHEHRSKLALALQSKPRTATRPRGLTNVSERPVSTYKPPSPDEIRSVLALVVSALEAYADRLADEFDPDISHLAAECNLARASATRLRHASHARLAQRGTLPHADADLSNTVPSLDDEDAQSECLRMQDLLSQRLSSVAHAVSRQQDMRSLAVPTSESMSDLRETAEERLLQELQAVASELDDALADWMIPRRLELKAVMGGSMLRTKSFDFLRSPPALSTDSLVSVNSLSSLQETPPSTPPSRNAPIPPKAALLLGLHDHDRERSHSASSWLTSLLRAVSPHAEGVDGQRLRTRRRRLQQSTGIAATSTVPRRDGSETERTSPGRPDPVAVTGTQHRGLRRLFRSLPALRTVAESRLSSWRNNELDTVELGLIRPSDAAEGTSRLSVRNSVRSQRSHSCSTVAQSTSNAHSEDHSGLSEVYAHYFSSSPHSASVLAAARSSLSLCLTTHEYSSSDSLPSIIECVEPVLDGGAPVTVDLVPRRNFSSPESPVRPRTEVASIWKPYRDLTPEVFDVTPRPCGIGGVSDVYSATWIANEPVDSTGNMFMKVAVKVVRVRKQSHDKTLKRLRREIHVWEQLNHHNVLPLCGVYFGLGDLPALISPWCENGDICDYLAKRQAEFVCDMYDLKLRLLFEVAEGLQYLHSHTPEIIHGDLKGANILVSDRHVAQLCDFGFASVLAQELGSFVLRSSSAKGTWRWMAPELFTQDDAQHTKATDIWAYGCVIAEVWSGRPPYHERLTEPAVVLAIARGEQPSRPQDVPEGLWSLATNCYASDPDQRPGLNAAVLAIRELRSMSA